MLASNVGETSLFFVIAALEDFIEKTWHVPEGSGGLYLPIKRQFISKGEVCIKLDIDAAYLDVLITRGEVEGFHNDEAEFLIYEPSIESSKFQLVPTSLRQRLWGFAPVMLFTLSKAAACNLSGR